MSKVKEKISKEDVECVADVAVEFAIAKAKLELIKGYYKEISDTLDNYNKADSKLDDICEEVFGKPFYRLNKKEKDRVMRYAQKKIDVLKEEVDGIDE